MADLDFFFDPICPWAWITSRLTVEVARQRELAVDWRFICLRMVNEDKEYERDFPPGLRQRAHAPAQRMLRIAAAPVRTSATTQWARSYTAFGEQLHTAGRSEEIRDGDDSVIGEAVEIAGLPAALVRRLRRRGRSTPSSGRRPTSPSGAPARTSARRFITFAPGTAEETSFFGPVVARIPRGEEALRIWDAVELLARTPGFAELKRSARDRPTYSLAGSRTGLLGAA